MVRLYHTTDQQPGKYTLNRSLNIIESIFQGPSDKIWKLIYQYIKKPERGHSGCHYKTAMAFRRLYAPNSLYKIILIGPNDSFIHHSIVADYKYRVIFDSTGMPTKIDRKSYDYLMGGNITGSIAADERSFVQIAIDLGIGD